MARLELHGLRKSFGPTHVLHGVDLAVPDAEMLVIVGASGCGKSTLLRLVAGLDHPGPGGCLLAGGTSPPSIRAPGTWQWSFRTTRSIRT